MAKAERSPASDIPSVKIARRQFKLAERDVQLMQGYDSGSLNRFLARRLYKLGFIGPAARLAPEEITSIIFHDARQALDDARFLDAKSSSINTDDSIPSSTPRLGKFEAEAETHFPKNALSNSISISTENNSIDIAPEEIVAHKEKVDDPPETVDWRQWNMLDDEERENQEIVEEEQVIFDEDKKRVGLLKGKQNPIITEITNSELKLYIKNASKSIAKDGFRDLTQDLYSLFAFLIENPRGSHIKVMRGSSSKFRIGLKLYNLLEIDPRKIPNITYSHLNTKTLRIIVSIVEDMVVVSDILKHERFARKFKGGRKE